MREEWLGDFGKARHFTQTSRAVGEATVTLSLGRDVLSRWVPTGQVRQIDSNPHACITDTRALRDSTMNFNFIWAGRIVEVIHGW